MSDTKKYFQCGHCGETWDITKLIVGDTAKSEGFGFIGIEREKEYFEIACKRNA